MLRVKIDALTIKAGKYWYLESLFSGMGFKLYADGSVQSLEIEQGEIKGDYNSVFAPAGFVSSNQINISGFTEDDIEEVRNDSGLSYEASGMELQLFLNKEKYTGLAFVFYKDFCIRELGYADGFLVGDASWDPLGILQSLSIEGYVDQNYAWHPSGTLKSAQISRTDLPLNSGAVTKLKALLRFSEENKLIAVSLDGDFEDLENTISNISMFPIRSLHDLKECQASSIFNFFGGMAFDEVFISMLQQGAFILTKEIGVSSRLLNRLDIIDLLSILKNLEKITFFAAIEDHIDASKKIKREIQNIKIILEVSMPSKAGVYTSIEIDI